MCSNIILIVSSSHRWSGARGRGTQITRLKTHSRKLVKWLMTSIGQFTCPLFSRRWRDKRIGVGFLFDTNFPLIDHRKMGALSSNDANWRQFNGSSEIGVKTATFDRIPKKSSINKCDAFRTFRSHLNIRPVKSLKRTETWTKIAYSFAHFREQWNGIMGHSSSSLISHRRRRNNIIETIWISFRHYSCGFLHSTNVFRSCKCANDSRKIKQKPKLMLSLSHLSVCHPKARAHVRGRFCVCVCCVLIAKAIWIDALNACQMHCVFAVSE